MCAWMLAINGHRDNKVGALDGKQFGFVISDLFRIT